MLVGVGVKAAAALGLAGGSYLLGTLPSCLGLNRSCSQSLLLSLVLCFGGGVLFATSVVHVLSEAGSLGLEANVLFCGGFISIYLLDELIKLCEAGAKTDCQLEVKGLLDRSIHHQYNTIDEHNHYENQENECDEGGNISIKIKNTNSTRIGLLLAFSTHSIIEGLVIGVQTIPSKVLLLVGAVSSHKMVVAFCLGAELASDGRSFLSLSRSMLIYSLGSSIGIGLGMLINQRKSDPDNSSIPVLQAFTAGSLLFIAASEVLPRERSRWEHHKDHSYAGLLQLLFFTLGFSAIASLILLL